MPPHIAFGRIGWVTQVIRALLGVGGFARPFPAGGPRSPLSPSSVCGSCSPWHALTPTALFSYGGRHHWNGRGDSRRKALLRVELGVEDLLAGPEGRVQEVRRSRVCERDEG